MVQTPNGEKRQRKQTTRSRKGCLTCKIGNFKCGEEKPKCQRCLVDSAGCDDYGHLMAAKTLKSQEKRPLLPKANTSLLITISTSPFENDREMQYFNLFTQYTIFSISPTLDSDNLKYVLLQTYSSHPSIRHNILAIAALNEVSFMSTECEQSSSSQAIYSKQQHHQAVLSQYTKAIRETRVAAKPNLDPKLALLTCHLIICFEVGTGNFQSVIQQITIAINLISSWQSQHHDGTIQSEIIISQISQPNGILLELILIFHRLVICLQFYNPSWTTNLRAQLPLPTRPSASNMPATFSSLSEAALYHDTILRPNIDFSSSHLQNPRPKDPASGLAPSPTFVVNSIPIAAIR
ncbi:hypothetical protein BDZ45DRAFT_735714 [Acephala macrosclerotiorum]|nr:hypothetical protein BDZ45DRAFT_735714 [Acephala macrosclerotiorum]